MKQIKIFFLSSLLSLLFWDCTDGNKIEHVLSFSFEDDISTWHASKSVQLLRSIEKKHEGQMSLKIHGVSTANTWSFANTKHITLEKGKHYRLTGWMLVDYAGTFMPFFKCGRFIQGSGWLRSSMSTQYNKEQINEWQELIADFDTPVDKETELVLAVEKRPFDEAVEATIYVDDITLSIIN